MALPKKRISKTRRDRRRSHLALNPSSPSVCPHCKQPARPHRVCSSCGYYAGVEIQAPEE